MKPCPDSRFEEILHAYELGLLSDEDRAAFEIHQLECEYCFQQARQFQDPVFLIEHDPDVRASIKKLDEEDSLSTAEQAGAEEGRNRRSRPLMSLRALAIAAAVLLVLILKPWQIEFRPDHEVLAGEDRLAILYFTGSPDQEQTSDLGKVITDLLITDLSDSRYINVVPSHRLHDIIEILSKERSDAINLYVVEEVANKTHARWMLTGSIQDTDTAFVVSTELIDVATDSTIASEQVSASSAEDIFTLVDRLAAAIRNHLPLPEASRREIDKPVSDVTTGSLEAYRCYLKGVDDYYKLYWKEALQNFQAALELDSTFAMAYYYLARIQQPNYINKAVEYSHKATQKQQYYIRSMQAAVEGDISRAAAELEKAVERYPDEKDALQMLGEYMFNLQRYDEAISYGTRVIEIDPLNKRAYNMLAYSYDRIGNLEKSIWSIGQYISIAPDEANPYDTRGEILANNGMIDQAIASYKRALEIKPDFYSSQMNLGLLCLINGDYAAAETCFVELAAVNNAASRSSGLLYLTYVPLYRGKFDSALSILNEGIASDMNDPGARALMNKHGLKAVVLREKGELQSAMGELDTAIVISREQWRDYEFLVRSLRVQILAEQGAINAAEQAADELRRDLAEADYSESAYWYARGSIQFAVGNMTDAIASFDKSIAGFNHFTLPTHYMLGRACLEAGELGKAVQQFEGLRSQHADPRLYFGPWTVKSDYYLGLAYERSGWNDKAVEQYEAFLHLWKDADPGITMVGDAKERLTRLKNLP